METEENDGRESQPKEEPGQTQTIKTDIICKVKQKPCIPKTIVQTTKGKSSNELS